MAPRDDLAELYRRVGSLERHQTRVETTLWDEHNGMLKDFEGMKLWQDEIKKILNRGIGIYIGVSLVVNALLTIAMHWISKHL